MMQSNLIFSLTPKESRGRIVGIQMLVIDMFTAGGNPRIRVQPADRRRSDVSDRSDNAYRDHYRVPGALEVHQPNLTNRR